MIDIPLRLQLPASADGEREEYRYLIIHALDEVTSFLRSAGFELDPGGLIDSVVVFDRASDTREHMAAALGVRPEDIPETFAGTVAGKRLFLVTRESYFRIWQGLYPDWPWNGLTYRGLVVHELTHLAHEEVAVSTFGSADAMGPVWFFEGLAVMCARQFETNEPLMTKEEMMHHVGGTTVPRVSYPLFGRLTRSLAGQYGLHELISRASEPGFPETLWSQPWGSAGHLLP